MIKKAILIVTWYGTTQYCLDLLKSLESYTKYDIVVAINEVESCIDQEFLNYLKDRHIQALPIQGNRWECGGLMAMTVFTGYDEFICIQDTLEIKDPFIFDKMFEYEGRSVSYGPGWQSFLGKYRREVLSRVEIPLCLTKMDAFYQEIRFGASYNYVASKIEGKEPIILFPEWGNDNPKNWVEEKFGRLNIVLDNPYLIKRKSLEWRGTNWNIGPFAITV